MPTSLVACPPEITPIRSLVMKTDEQQVEDVIRDMCNKDHNVGMKHMSDDCVFVRPSGNPLDKSGWDAMMNNADVSVTSNELVGNVLGTFNSFSEYFALQDENEQLKEENARLLEKLNQQKIAKEVVLEDSILQTTFTFVPAKIINNSVST